MSRFWKNLWKNDWVGFFGPKKTDGFEVLDAILDTKKCGGLEPAVCSEGV